MLLRRSLHIHLQSLVAGTPTPIRQHMHWHPARLMRSLTKIAQTNRGRVGNIQHQHPHSNVLPSHRQLVHNVNTGHKSYDDHFDDREQGNVLLRSECASRELAHSRNYPVVIQTYYEFMEHYLLDDDMFAHGCDTYAPDNVVSAPSHAPTEHVVPIRVTQVHVMCELAPVDWNHDFETGHHFQALFEHGNSPTPLSNLNMHPKIRERVHTASADTWA